MAKKIYKRILISEVEIGPDQWQRTYKRVLDHEAMAQRDAAEQTEPEPEANLSSMLKRELLAMAEEKGIEGLSSKNTKAQIIAALQE